MKRHIGQPGLRQLGQQLARGLDAVREQRGAQPALVDARDDGDQLVAAAQRWVRTSDDAQHVQQRRIGVGVDVNASTLAVHTQVVSGYRVSPGFFGLEFSAGGGK